MPDKLIVLKAHQSFSFREEDFIWREKGKEKDQAETDPGNKKEELKSFYFMRSQYYPQQTSVYGLLRYQIHKVNDEPLSELGTSFRPTGGTFPLTLGPILYRKNGMTYYPLLVPKGETCCCFSPTNFKGVLLNGKEFKDFYEVKNYKAKKGTEMIYVPLDSTYDVLKRDDIYLETNEVRTHNKKIAAHGRSGDDQEAFFKIEHHHLCKDSAFVLRVTSDYDIPGNPEVHMGQKKSRFSLSVEQYNSSDYIKINPKESTLAEGIITFVSDTYVDIAELKKYCRGMLVDIKSFRNITTPKNGNGAKINYHKLTWKTSEEHRKTNIYRSERRNMIKAGGSVFYKGASQRDNIIELLKKDNWQEVGYNHFVIRDNSDQHSKK